MEDALLEGLEWSDQGVSEATIEEAKTQVQRLPGEYLNVLRRHDGGEGWVGDGAYLRLWGIEDLESENETLQATDYVPGFILIGTDGADDLYAIELETGAYWIFPAVGLGIEEGRRVAASWGEFLQALSQS